jgi:hypothetical protein
MVFYKTLCRLAKNSRIWARLVDLRHEKEVRSFCGELKSKGLTLGVIDTSDVPNSTETGTSVAAQYVKLISQYAPEGTLFVNTAPTGGHGVQRSSRPRCKRHQARVRDRDEEDQLDRPVAGSRGRSRRPFTIDAADRVWHQGDGERRGAASQEGHQVNSRWSSGCFCGASFSILALQGDA